MSDGGRELTSSQYQPSTSTFNIKYIASFAKHNGGIKVKAVMLSPGLGLILILNTVRLMEAEHIYWIHTYKQSDITFC